MGWLVIDDVNVDLETMCFRELLLYFIVELFTTALQAGISLEKCIEGLHTSHVLIVPLLPLYSLHVSLNILVEGVIEVWHRRFLHELCEGWSALH